MYAWARARSTDYCTRHSINLVIDNIPHRNAKTTHTLSLFRFFSFSLSIPESLLKVFRHFSRSQLPIYSAYLVGMYCIPTTLYQMYSLHEFRKLNIASLYNYLSLLYFFMFFVFISHLLFCFFNFSLSLSLFLTLSLSLKKSFLLFLLHLQLKYRCLFCPV